MLSKIKYNSLLVHKCNVLRKSDTQNSLTGEVTEEWTLLASDVPCLIQPLSGNQAIEAQGLEVVAQYKGFFRGDADINLRDKIVFDGKTFLVSYLFLGWEGGAHHKEVMLSLEVSTDAL